MSDQDQKINRKAHRLLLQTVNSIGDVKYVPNSTRNEAHQKQDEFHVIKSGQQASHSSHSSRKGRNLETGDVANILKRTEKYVGVGKQMLNVLSSKNVVEKPVAKVAADRTKRSVAFSVAKTKLARWDALVESNRSVESKVFPIPSGKNSVNSYRVENNPVSLQSDLLLKMNEIDSKLTKNKDNETESNDAKHKGEFLQKKLVREELLAKRREIQYLRMRESQRSAKARMRNKIKSKTYRKLMRKEASKNQSKLSENADQTDGEDGMDRKYALERATLRHKNNSAKMKAKGKLSANMRNELQEIKQQYQKIPKVEREEAPTLSEIGNSGIPAEDYANPWTGPKPEVKVDSNIVEGDSDEDNEEQTQMETNGEESLDEKEEKVEIEKPVKTKNKKCKGNSKGKSRKGNIENGWIIEPVDEADNDDEIKGLINIDDVFDKKTEELERKSRNKVKRIVSREKDSSESLSKIAKKNHSKKSYKDLSFKSAKKVPILDESLNECDPKEQKKTPATESGKENKFGANSDIIDPSVFKTLNLNTKNKNEITIGSDFDNANKMYTDFDPQITISESFEDMTDLKKEESPEVDIKASLSMPGWGSWSASTRTEKSKRFVPKSTPKVKDELNGRNPIFINDVPSKHLRAHQVSDLPHPFTSLQDFEASFRAPIGRECVPETAFRMLTRPEVVTKRGQIIEPIDESHLLKSKKPFM